MRPAHRRTLATTKPNLEREKPQKAQTYNGKIFITRPHSTPEDAPRAPAHACYNKADFRTRKSPRKRKLTTEKFSSRAPTPHRKVRPAHRRTLATTKPNLEREKDLQAQTYNGKIFITRPHSTPEGAPRAPAHACYNKADFRTRKRPASANLERKNFHHAPHSTPEGAPRAPAHACYNKADFRTRKAPASANLERKNFHHAPHSTPEGAPRAPAHACYNKGRT